MSSQTWPTLEQLPTWSEHVLRERVMPRLPRAEERPGQVRMLRAVARALVQGRVLLCEAGTGTGKTLAYLIPAVGLAKVTGRPVILSTSTIPLQQQVVEKDLPLLAQAWPEPVRVALAKGRSNYACLRKVEDGLAQLSLFGSEGELLRWVRETDAGGDLRYLPPSLRAEAHRIAGDETCTANQCPYFGPCFYFRARRAWEEADLIVCNHALLMADLVQRRAGKGILPEPAAVIIDEAHDLEEAARSALEQTVSEAALQRLLRALLASRPLREAPARWQVAVRDRAAHVSAVASFFFSALGLKEGTWPYDPASVGSTAQELVEALGDLADQLRSGSLPEAAAAEAAAFARCFDDARGVLEAAGSVSDTGEDVAWVRVAAVGAAELHVSPIGVSEVLRHELVERGIPLVFTSATLTVGGRFDAFARRVGVSRANVALVPSPFDYRSQCLLWVPRNLPLPNDPAFQAAAVEVMRQVMMALEGRTLVLFTSHEALQAAAESLRATLPYPVLVQGEADRTELIQNFREDERAVLLGTASFWQGIDVPGSSLSCVIVERLPFAVPDEPLQQARYALAERQGQSPFWTVALPEAVIRFRQGTGRLIRSRQDRGLLVILDRRIETRSYGRWFLSAVPGYRRVHSLHEAARLLGLREPAPTATA